LDTFFHFFRCYTTTGSNHMITDTTFFINEPGYALIDRIRKTRKASSGIHCLLYLKALHEREITKLFLKNAKASSADWKLTDAGKVIRNDNEHQ